jgi:L-fucose mutarotase
MLRGHLIHPEILQALGQAGHGAQILIADGNYPLLTRSHPNAHRVYLNLSPGLVAVPDVLKAIISVTPMEAAHVMMPDDGSDPSIFADFRNLLPTLALQKLDRWTFYEHASSPHTALAIATGEQRIYANILLTIGVVV